MTTRLIRAMSCGSLSRSLTSVTSDATASWIGATAGNTTVAAHGYLDGVQIESEDLDVSFDGSHKLEWSRVDEVRFEGTTDLFSCFDDFTYESLEP